MTALSIPDQLREIARNAQWDFDAERLHSIADEFQRLQDCEAALEVIYGKCGEEVWPGVARGENTPPWPLPEVLAAQGLSIGRGTSMTIIWSEEHGRWWRPGWAGYTNQIADAGRYSAVQAEKIVRDANYGSTFNEIAIPVPEGLDALIKRSRKTENDNAN